MKSIIFSFFSAPDFPAGIHFLILLSLPYEKNIDTFQQDWEYSFDTHIQNSGLCNINTIITFLVSLLNLSLFWTRFTVTPGTNGLIRSQISKSVHIKLVCLYFFCFNVPSLFQCYCKVTQNPVSVHTNAEEALSRDSYEWIVLSSLDSQRWEIRTSMCFMNRLTLQSSCLSPLSIHQSRWSPVLCSAAIIWGICASIHAFKKLVVFSQWSC